LTNRDRTTIGRIGAYTKWGNTEDRVAATAPARAALERKFIDAAGGDPLRAAALRKAYFQRLALTSAKARRARRTVAEGEAAEAELRAIEAELRALGGASE
jgi:hypothetical protein